MKTTCRGLAAFALPALVAVAISACATEGGRQPESLEKRLADRGYAMGETVERISDYRINGYNSLGDSHVILDAGVSRYYLITVLSPCMLLSNGETLGFTTTSNSLTRFDQLVVLNQPTGPQKCAITEIRQLNKLDKSAGAKP